MNFLFHHHLALRDLGTPEAAVGAMLPDLWRMADRRVRPAVGAIALTIPIGDEAAALGPVLAGIAHHVVADRWFHRDPVFLDGEQRCAERLRPIAAEVPRIGLFAHVLWELCLDGALLSRVGLFPVLHALREGFAATLGAASDRAVEVHHFDRVGRSVADRQGFAPRLARLCAAIADGPWIDGYQSGEGLAYRIQGVRARLGMDPVPVEAHALLADACDELLDAAVPVADRILAAAISS
ncbi:MAG: hypothetical protein ABJE95_15800 [Byssovorax sp.]